MPVSVVHLSEVPHDRHEAHGSVRHARRRDSPVRPRLAGHGLPGRRARPPGRVHAGRLHSSEPLRVQVHNGDSILVRGVVDASSTGGLRLVFDPSALRVEHTHANTFDARTVFDALRGRKD